MKELMIAKLKAGSLIVTKLYRRCIRMEKSEISKMTWKF